MSHISEWRTTYILSAALSEKIAFAGSIQENQVVQNEQEIFYINPGNNSFFGNMAIPQMNMGKVKLNQQVLI